MKYNLKHNIKAGLEKNPDFYKPLAQRLDELKKINEVQRLDEAHFSKTYTTIEDEIINN